MNNYRRGYAVELRVKEILEGAGFLVIRAAGSHGPFDLVAIGEKEVKLVQVKRTKKNPRGIAIRVLRELEGVKAPPSVSIEVWVWVERRGFCVFHASEGEVKMGGAEIGHRQGMLGGDCPQVHEADGPRGRERKPEAGDGKGRHRKGP